MGGGVRITSSLLASSPSASVSASLSPASLSSASLSSEESGHAARRSTAGVSPQVFVHAEKYV